MIANRNRYQIVDPNFFPDPGMRTYGKKPRVLDVHIWLYHNLLSDFGSKKSQKNSFQAGKRKEIGLKNYRA
jgi:hypothetical protein